MRTLLLAFFLSCFCFACAGLPGPDSGYSLYLVRHAEKQSDGSRTPELARLLCDCKIEDMDESEYDRLIVISVVDGKSRVVTLQQNNFFKSN